MISSNSCYNLFWEVNIPRLLISFPNYYCRLNEDNLSFFHSVEAEETPLSTGDVHQFPRPRTVTGDRYRLHSAANDSLGPQFPLLKSITESVVLCGCSLNKMADFLWASVIWQVRLVKGYDPVNLFALLAPR